MYFKKTVGLTTTLVSSSHCGDTYRVIYDIVAKYQLATAGRVFDLALFSVAAVAVDGERIGTK